MREGVSAMLDGRVRPALTLLVLATATLLGGSAVPALMLIVELAALPLLVLVIALPPHPDRLARAAGWLCVAAAATVALQLVPLPDALSRALPGHAVATALRDTAKIRGPFALSLDPQATLGSGLALIPGVTIMLSALRASPVERARLVALAVAIGGLSALLGLYQVATGGPYLFADSHVGQATGLFANRNHQGALILPTMLLLAQGREWARDTRRRLLLAVPILLLGMCAVLTTSRATLLLLPAVLGIALAAVFVRARVPAWRAAATALAGVALLAVATHLPVVAPTVERLASAGDDGRFGYWQDVAVAIRAFWPVGSGFGTFPAVYATVEDLDGVGRLLVNHAHNEVLELVLEGGAAAAALLLAWVLLLAAAAWRNRSVEAWTALAAVVAVAAVSLTEFPLRNFTVAAVFALAHAVLLSPGSGIGTTKNRLTP